MENGYPYSIPSELMYSTSVTGTLTGGVGTSAKFLGNGGIGFIHDVDCGTWAKVVDNRDNVTCTRRNNDAASTVITKREAFFGWGTFNGGDVFILNSTNYYFFHIFSPGQSLEMVGKIPYKSITPYAVHPDLFFF